MLSLFFQLTSILIILTTKCLSIFKQFCIFGLQSIWIIIQTWIELLGTSLHLHIRLFRTTLVWAVAFLSLPSRIFNAFKTERLLQRYVCEMRAELEDLVWEKKELKEQLNRAIKERKIMEVILAELEEEYDQAVTKIQLLEGQLQDLKNQNHQLVEVQCKASQSSTHQFETDKRRSNMDISTTPPKPTNEGATESKLKKTDEMVHPFSTDPAHILYARRERALLQSLFSATLSLVVGIIVLEAKEPCMPLVVALFSVVAMSLKSVVEFFFSIKNKPASDAVALLSFNWFVIGTLTYPTLPRVVYTSMPFLSRFVTWTMRSFALLEGYENDEPFYEFRENARLSIANVKLRSHNLLIKHDITSTIIS